MEAVRPGRRAGEGRAQPISSALRLPRTTASVRRPAIRAPRKVDVHRDHARVGFGETRQRGVGVAEATGLRFVDIAVPDRDIHLKPTHAAPVVVRPRVAGQRPGTAGTCRQRLANLVDALALGFEFLRQQLVAVAVIAGEADIDGGALGHPGFSAVIPQRVLIEEAGLESGADDVELRRREGPSGTGERLGCWRVLKYDEFDVFHCGARGRLMLPSNQSRWRGKVVRRPLR